MILGGVGGGPVHPHHAPVRTLHRFFVFAPPSERATQKINKSAAHVRVRPFETPLQHRSKHAGASKPRRSTRRKRCKNHIVPSFSERVIILSIANLATVTLLIALQRISSLVRQTAVAGSQKRLARCLSAWNRSCKRVAQKTPKIAKKFHFERGREHSMKATSPMKQWFALKDRCSPGGKNISSCIVVDNAAGNKSVFP